MKQKSARPKWAEEGGREAVIAVMRMNDTPQWIIDKFCTLGLREQFNKSAAIMLMVANPAFKREVHTPIRQSSWQEHSIFSWQNIGKYTYF